MSKNKTKQHAEKNEKKEPSVKELKPAVNHPVSSYKVAVYAGVCTVAILFLSANLYASQMIHPIYQKLVDNEPAAWVSFFKIARNNEKTKPYLYEVSGKYRELQAEINADNSTRLEMITKLEESLSLNPQARDVLYGIAILYQESGDEAKAAEYLERARKVDPSLNL
jgi:tetratricopeptide (TPR) repeat protein